MLYKVVSLKIELDFFPSQKFSPEIPLAFPDAKSSIFQLAYM